MPIEQFFPARRDDMERRLKQIEDYLGRLPSEVYDPRTQAVTSTTSSTGSTTTGSSGGSSGGGSSTLAGDVSGPIAANTVERLQSVDLPAPAAGDNNRFVKYNNGTPAFEYSTVAMAGDVSGTNEAAVVDKLKTAALPAAPGAGQAFQVLRWNNGTPAYEFTRITNICPLGTWVKADISTLAGADAAVDNAWAGAAGVTIGNPMPVAGGLVALTVKLTGDVGAATQDLVTTIYKNGVATALVATITGAGGTEDEAIATTSSISFSQGDDISVQMKHSGVAPAAVRAVAVVWGYLNT